MHTGLIIKIEPDPLVLTFRNKKLVCVNIFFFLIINYQLTIFGNITAVPIGLIKHFSMLSL